MIHLNSAGSALPAPGVLETVQEYLRREAEVGGYELADLSASAIEGTYRNLAALIGAAPRNIAVVESATEAYARAVESFDPGPGDVVLTTRNDYVSNQLFFLSLAERRRVEVVHAADLPEGGVDPDDVARKIRERSPIFVSVTHVPTSSGLVQPASEVGRICRELGVPYLLDACQSVGQFPVDVAALGCDFLCATGRKFLRGPRGTGFLYVSDRMLDDGAGPLLPDLRGATWSGAEEYELAPDARRFEYWERSYALLLGLGAAAEYALGVGLEEIGRRSRRLAGRLRAGLADIEGVRVLDRGPALCAIVTAEVEDLDAPDIVDALRRREVYTSAISVSSARLDFAERAVRSAVRLSPHYFNADTDIDEALDALREIVGRRGSATNPGQTTS